MYWFEIFMYSLFFGWIPIVALKYLICGIIESINDCKCTHDFEYEETKLISEFSDIPSNISVSATCKKCGYHKTYLKYKR